MSRRNQESGIRNQEEGSPAPHSLAASQPSSLTASAPFFRSPFSVLRSPSATYSLQPTAYSLSVILAAHGSRREEEANRIVREQARRLQDDFGFESVRAAFWQGTPGFDQVLDESAGADSVVVPFFTSYGYYSGTVLPRELARNRSFGTGRLRLTPPLGTRPEMEQLAAQRVRRLLRRWNWPSDRTALLVIGHGTRRSPSSRLSTVALARRLRELEVAGQVEEAFLDEPPFIEEAMKRVRQPNVLLLPFLIGGSAHSLRDIPRRAGLTVSGFDSLPIKATVGPRRVACDQALGSDPAMAWVIARMVREEMAERLKGCEAVRL